MTNRVLIGASTGPGLDGLKAFVALRLGNCALADLPFDRDEAIAMMRYCREHEITLFLSELVYRGSTQLYRPEKTKIPREEFWSKDELNAILAEAGEFYGGRMTIGEAGGCSTGRRTTSSVAPPAPTAPFRPAIRCWRRARPTSRICASSSASSASN
jgi:hypothetical protein